LKLLGIPSASKRHGLYDDKKGRGWDLPKMGILRMAHIPDGYSLSAKQEIQREANRGTGLGGEVG
jgi:hypothetical protein